jgi:acyl dehydratase
MTAAPQPPLEPGMRLVTPGRTVAEADINLFAGLVGDFTPIHMDEPFARTTIHGTRIAHGPLTMATAIGLLTQTGILGARVLGLVSLSWDFAAAVKLGDTIRARVTVAELRPTSKPGRALATFAFEVVNQHDATVQTGQMRVILRAD